MDYKDYYKVMGVARDVSPDELRRAYRKLARKYHPDVSKEADAENRFKEVAEAYEVLKDPDKRKAYDELGDQWQAGQDFRPPPGYERQHDFHASNFSREDAAQFSEFFESLFGGRQPFGQQARNASFRARGQDIHAQIRIPLETAFHGVERMITLQVPEAEEGGRVALHNRTLNVKIPKGVQSGQQIRLAGQGGAGLGGGKAGDLYLKVDFEPHPLYRVDGRDLALALPVAPWEAALGATVEVPTPTGKVALKIPAGSGADRRLRLKGRGLPAKHPGDLYITLKIALPPAKTEEQKAFYQSMSEAFSFDPRSGMEV